MDNDYQQFIFYDMCVVGACGPGRGGEKPHSAEGFSQITSAGGWERGTTIHNTSL